jgi:O-antigen/teichoic acid export membrane protein
MLHLLSLRLVGALLAFSSLGLGRAYFDDVTFGTFAYVVQCITILVVFGQSGLEFLALKSTSRGQLRVTYQILYALLVAAPLVCFVTIVSVQLITGVSLSTHLMLITLIISVCVILNRYFASICFGFGQNTRYQIWDQSLRWAPLSLVMLTLVGLHYLNKPDSSLQTVFLLAMFGYVLIATLAVLTSSLFQSSKLPLGRPRPRFIVQLFLRGSTLNAPSAMLFLLGVIDQFLLLRILDLADYGVYRIATLAVTALAMVVDVLGLSIRRKFMAERDVLMRSPLFYELRSRFRLLALVGLIGGVGLLGFANSLPHTEYIQLIGIFVAGHSVANFYGDPMMALKVSGKENLATLIVIFMIIVSPPLTWALISTQGIIGAVIANVLIAVITKLLLSTAAKQTDSILPLDTKKIKSCLCNVD